MTDHRALGLWAAECAERLLPYFEEKYGVDTRPRDAIRTLRDWARTGEFHMSVIRAAALSAHAAAKKVDKEDKAANFAAHAAGQAVGTAHVPTHAVGVVLYSIKLIAAINSTDVKSAVAKERRWQTEHLPKNLRRWVNSWVARTQRLWLIPKLCAGRLTRSSQCDTLQTWTFQFLLSATMNWVKSGSKSIFTRRGYAVRSVART